VRTVHRLVAAFTVLFGFYISSTGILIQLLDLHAVLGRAPADDPTMQAIRVGHDGPPNYQVIREPDYSAESLPADFDFAATLSALFQGARAQLGGAPISFLEVRMMDGKPIGQLASHGLVYRFDAAGALLGAPAPLQLPPLSTPSFRNTVKDVHRMRVFSPAAIAVDVLAGLALSVLLFTGLVLYFRLLSARIRIRRRWPFWVAGGWWRSLHRMVAVIAATLLVVVALSGMVLGLSSVGVAINQAVHHGRPGLTVDASSPLQQAELPAMLRTTLAAYRAIAPDTPIKVLRLRYFAGMPQGVIVAGAADTQQLVFNALNGRSVGEAEQGYPDTGMPFGWQLDQIAKQIHRGDFIGLSGRWLDLLAGLSLLYLSLSGAIMYFELWSRRRRTGRPALFWR
jgi:uncharacterized iron-regulated membrane protein